MGLLAPVHPRRLKEAVIHSLAPPIFWKLAMILVMKLTPKQAYSLRSFIAISQATGRQGGLVSLEHANGAITNHSLGDALVLIDAYDGVAPRSPVGRVLAQITYESINQQLASQRVRSAPTPAQSHTSRRNRISNTSFGLIN